METAFSVTITYMEIYNEKIFDLLVDPAVDATKASHSFGEQGHYFVAERCAFRKN